jgi:hypothetical protein
MAQRQIGFAARASRMMACLPRRSLKLRDEGVNVEVRHDELRHSGSNMLGHCSTTSVVTNSARKKCPTNLRRAVPMEDMSRGNKRTVAHVAMRMVAKTQQCY